MISKRLVIGGKLGLHARAACALVKAASAFRSEITLERAALRASAREVLALLLLGVGPGQAVTVVAEGDDEIEAMRDIERLILRDFQVG